MAISRAGQSEPAATPDSRPTLSLWHNRRRFATSLLA